MACRVTKRDTWRDGGEVRFLLVYIMCVRLFSNEECAAIYRVEATVRLLLLPVIAVLIFEFWT